MIPDALDAVCEIADTDTFGTLPADHAVFPDTLDEDCQTLEGIDVRYILAINEDPLDWSRPDPITVTEEEPVDATLLRVKDEIDAMSVLKSIVNVDLDVATEATSMGVPTPRPGVLARNAVSDT